MAGRPLRDEDLAFLSGQLAALTAREAPLSGGLRAMAADAPEGPLRAAVARLADDVERGVSLSKAVQAQPTAFPELLAAAVEAGEASNSLPDVLSSFSRHCRMFASLRVRAWHAAIYPAVLLFVGVMVILFAETLVMPYMREMLREMNVEVPFFCQAALWLSGHVAHFIVFALFVLAVTTAGLRVLRRSLAGRRAYERLVLELPWVGAVTRNSLHARFCRGLALLLKAGAPLPRALRLAIHSGGSAVLAGPGQAMVSQVESGVPLSAAMAGQKFFPDEMVRTVQVAEKRGDLPEAVLDLADMYEQETEYAARVLRGVLPGLALVVVLPMMGLVVLSVLSPFLSLFRVMQSIGSGGGPQGGSPTAMGITIAIWLIPILVLIRMALSWAGGHPHQRARGFVTRHLAFVTRRNLPLGPALQTLAQAGPVAFRWQLKKLFSHVEAGQPLACAMSRFPRLFPPAYVSMVRAGETNGNLAAVFQKLQTYDEAVIRFQRRLALTL
ncbi:MAG: hypothetical protein FJ279_18495, partial [Planctomycetes bacterium]|nr:hypothetical protein [Planctomycetota bacterium]